MSRLAADWWFVIPCVMPWLLLAGVYSEAAIAAALLSHWPRPSYDDPMSLSTAPLHLLNLTLIVATWSAVPLVALASVMNVRHVRRSTSHLAWLAVFVGGFVLLGLLVRVDPGRVWYWLGD